MNGKQLKNSILQWAIQGKLVPQDPNDEPASVLLEKIRQEKERLIKEKKIKRDKNASIIYRGEDNSYYEKILATGEVKCIDEEVPFEIPATWNWARLSNITSILGDGIHGTPEYEKGQKVTGLVRQKTEVGFKVIVDNQWNGMVYDNEIYRHVTTGDHIDCYVKEVRFDGKIDLSLQPIGHQHTEEFAEVLLRYLEEHDGICQLGDKSDAEDIKNTFEVSKKAFKRAIGDLYKRRLITVEPMCIKLI